MESDQYDSELDNFAPAQQQITDEFSKWQLWGEDIIEQLKHDLRAETFDADQGETGRWIKGINVEALMNEEGINTTVSVIRMCGINKFALLSNLDKEAIYKMVLEVVNELTLLYVIEHHKFGITSTAFASMIITKIHYFLQNALLMAADGEMRKYLGTTVQEVRQYRTPLKEEKKGGSMFGLFGRGGSE